MTTRETCSVADVACFSQLITVQKLRMCWRAFGARPLKRVMQRRILDALATEILKGALREGDTVVARAREKGGDELAFDVKHRKQ